VTGTDVQEATPKMSDSVPQLELDQLRSTVAELRVQLAGLSERVAGMEQLAQPAAKAAPQAASVAEAPATNASVAAEAGITEEEVLAISAALAAWLGVHPHIRQIRLIRSGSWAQQGRVTIQTSHGLHY
jgi:methylmalonyl-CoA carboxyltransferase large subunit